MQTVMTTKLSSRGQIVLPEALRIRGGWDVGTPFAVFGRGDTVILRVIKPLPENEFDQLANECAAEAIDVGLTQDDLTSIISSARKSSRVNCRLRTP